ncbi:hypothetical protein C5472_09750 [Photorhabdus sp. RW14-46]|uniref:Photorhabdus luminescens subsp. laumondii TTO1 complete genome segment 15/17 n=1 Tax=Photorhabdus laumondii subsp. laumondii (strain DSM 15139 / CIP 105565 / TT01) TaxID=243265 RepID=Q7MZG0_PHOLL|nr:hypothetical protein [Photorhabdus laumondii]AXG49192.1 hypothetical protein PluTT01m_22125 [Photorhabdus laumondii subsp. laumondii]NHB61402.1 hypothetical protein [Photorhabdus sp. RW14-46]CAE16701.1 unnamed protein product [Photorhabdus laumondii subsp. laumondii TTO1]
MLIFANILAHIVVPAHHWYWKLAESENNHRILKSFMAIDTNGHYHITEDIPVIFQVASLLAVLTYSGHIVIYAPEDSPPCRRDAF